VRGLVPFKSVIEGNVPLTFSVLGGSDVLGGAKHVVMRQRAFNRSLEEVSSLGLRAWMVKKGRSSEEQSTLWACGLA